MTSSSYTVKQKPENKILFVADHIGQLHGSALSAEDVLRSIPSDYRKYVLSPCSVKNNADIKFSFSANPFTTLLGKRKAGRKVLRLLPALAVEVLDWLSLKFLFWHFSFDLVVVNGYGSASTWGRVQPMLQPRTKTIVVSRESPRHFEFGDINISVESQIYFLRSFHFQIFVSNTLRKEWVQIADLRADRTFYLPNCCNEEKFLKIRHDKESKLFARKHLNIAQETLLLLNVGTLELRKGQQDLVELAIRLKKIGVDFIVACVGFPHGPEGLSLQKAVFKSSLDAHFILPGPSKDINEWFTAADLLVFTSRAEAMPRTVLESMASALPIVSTNVDGIPELITSEELGLLYTPGDIDQLEQMILLSINKNDESEQRGLNARDYYLVNFSKVAQANRFSQMLVSINEMEV